MTTNLETLATALYVKIDDALAGTRRWGRPPRLTDAELLTLAVMQALLGFVSEARWLRFARAHLAAEFPYLPGQSGYNKRLRAGNTLISTFIRTLARDSDLWHDDVWIVDSTPVECARSRPTVKRSDLAGWAGYGYCPSHSRFFWGLRLHLVCTPGGLPIAWALANPKIDEREVLADMLTGDQDLLATHPGQTIIGDKGYVSKHLDAFLAEHGLTLLRPSYRSHKPRPGEYLLKPIRQLIESVNDTLKGQLDLERHGARTPAGVLARVGQRILAMTAAIWHNRATGRSITRSLIAYDH
ncbi:IS982 family transposase [Streptomyces sp. Rer75]|uniref:IS982 family transposase n=1 Tax=Streptomyces sp. Rer75 TaxID=2750011 RepID=UPI0015D039A6|nr:IS982 family transposase [Streptomyces sp. Rer75]QLH22625.1 IS982 family transposase [Streptomyces sp. Rer75]QLH22680.1 IS982 family transposase [Streptomyces sp. Rer75]QLH25205.1 IS982 family transposase [Streptomyces sp. Rer75]QLH25437.1 IS982 family transposase [Streptomyces sp. Rer75]